MYFLCCMLVFLSITATALCKALCLLWCRKLGIPSYAKPIMLEAMPSNTEANIAPLPMSAVCQILRQYFPYHLPMCHRLCGYNVVFAFGKVVCTVQFSCNISKVLHS